MITESADHLVVVSAMSRLARCGGWARLLDGKPLEEPLDLLDAELLVEVGVLQRRADDTLEPVHLHPWYYDPAALAGGTLSLLRQALHHAEGTGSGWATQDPETQLAQGLASSGTAALIAESVLPRMSEAWAAVSDGPGTLLDVGVGVGGFSITMCQEFPRLRAVGIDVLPSVLALARTRVGEVGLSERIALRHESVADLRDVAAYDLAWLPQPFIASAAFLAGLARVHEALRPGGWLILLLAAPGRRACPLQRAVESHRVQVNGGSLIEADDVCTELEELGFDQVSELDTGDQTLVLARRHRSH